jgi:hypothetical protein
MLHQAQRQFFAACSIISRLTSLEGGAAQAQSVRPIIYRQAASRSISVILVVIVLREHLLQDPIVKVLQLHLLRVRDPAPPPVGRRRRRRRRGGGSAAHPANLGGEIEHGRGALHGECGAVVGPGCLLRGVEGTEPDARSAALGVPDLRGELAPRPLPHAAVLAFLLVILHDQLLADR